VHFGWQLAHFGCPKDPTGAQKVAKWYQYVTKLHKKTTQGTLRALASAKVHLREAKGTKRTYKNGARRGGKQQVEQRTTSQQAHQGVHDNIFNCNCAHSLKHDVRSV